MQADNFVSDEKTSDWLKNESIGRQQHDLILVEAVLSVLMEVSSE